MIIESLESCRKKDRTAEKINIMTMGLLNWANSIESEVDLPFDPMALGPYSFNLLSATSVARPSLFVLKLLKISLIDNDQKLI
jgi:hypothetical protein